jgi:hypothetical protein
VDTAHVILPNFTPGGKYVVSVTTGRAVGTSQGFRTDLTVTLELRSQASGTYFLATTHEGDAGSYFYPLTVR